jgi:hypothetical protein
LDLNPKTNYAIFHNNLKYFVARRLIATKIHKCLRFKTAPYLKDTINYLKDTIDTMDLRRTAAALGDDIISQVVKQMMVAIFGKILSNTGNQSDLKVWLAGVGRKAQLFGCCCAVKGLVIVAFD